MKLAALVWLLMSPRAHRCAAREIRFHASFVFLICSFFSISDGQPANPNDTSPAAVISPSTASPTPRLPPCPIYRAFLCYSMDALGEPYPEWLQQSDTPCSPCIMETQCAEGVGLSGHDEGNTPAVLKKCRPQFCQSDVDASDDTDCIKAVLVNGEKVFFPFNLCTRAMVATGECDGKKLSTKRYDPTSGRLTTEYLVQCDADFLVPKFVVDANAADKSRQLTCVPSLQLAAGFLKDSPSPLQDYPYNVPDLLDFEYCGKGGRQPTNSACQPLPICEDVSDTPSTRPFANGLVKIAPECDVPCHYEYGRMNYSDCVFLDIVDAGAKRFFSARRALSGPYAEFMSDEQTLAIGRAHTESTRAARAAANDLTERAIRYPKCVDTVGLLNDDLWRVESDMLLNCKKNIFAQTSGTAELMIRAPICQWADELRVCQNRSSNLQLKPNTTLATPVSDEGWQLWQTIASVTPLLVVVVVSLAAVCFCARRRTPKQREVTAVTAAKQRLIPHDTASSLPETYAPEYIALHIQDMAGNWGDDLGKKLTGEPKQIPDETPKHFRLPKTGHTALQAEVKYLADGQKPDEEVKCKKGTNDASAPVDALTVAKNIVRRLSEDTWVWGPQPPKKVDKKGDSDAEKKKEKPKKVAQFDAAELAALFTRATEVVSEQRGAVHLTGPVWIVGDLKGDLISVWRIVKAYSTMADAGTKLLFLGNLGSSEEPMSVAVIALVVAMMIIYPKNMFYLCGEFELPKKDKKARFSEPHVTGKQVAEMNNAIDAFFARLPIFATIDRRILVVHGGPCPELTKELLREGFDLSDPKLNDLRVASVMSCPQWHRKEFEKKKANDGGYLFGKQAVADVRKQLDVDFIIRGNESLNAGIKLFGDWVISLYSTPTEFQEEPGQTPRRCAGFFGVLRYDGTGLFTMLHFVAFDDFHESGADCENFLKVALGQDVAFMTQNVEVDAAAPTTTSPSGDTAPTPTK